MGWLLNTKNRYIKTALVSFSIWVIAILINAVLFAVVALIQENSGHFWEAIGLVLLVSAVYSFPGIIIFWLVFIFNFYQHKIFTILLVAAMATSFLAVLCMLLLLGNGSVHIQSIPVITMAMLSAVIAVALHRAAITDVIYIDTDEIEINKKFDSLET